MLQGLYKVEMKTVHGSRRGVLYCLDGKMLGGNSAFAFIGTYRESGGEVTVEISAMRHNVNNHLAMIVAAAELQKRKPELAERMMDNILQQPEKIIAEVRSFSDEFESLLGITRDGSFTLPQPLVG